MRATATDRQHDAERAAAALDSENDRPSKSQRKRDVTALQKLGEALAELPAEQLARFDLPESLRDALRDVRTIRAHEARRRQLQYIGRLMRNVDAEPIQRALDDLRAPSRATVALMHQCERLRDALLADDDELTSLLEMLPTADPQPLRAMIRAARREQSTGQPPRQARLLYRWLHEQLAAQANEPPAPERE
jgi:ribosome-associated protein